MQFDIANSVAAFVGVAALVVSVYALYRQHGLEKISYLTLSLSLEQVNEKQLIAHTGVENRSPTVKKLEAVRLLLCPLDEAPEQACNTLFADSNTSINHVGDIISINLDQLKRDEHRILMPINYYTVENSQVGDELLTYDVVLDVGTLESGRAYAVRMLLWGRGSFYRVVQRAFIR